MATPFTEITASSDMQDKTYYTEIEHALYERFRCIGEASPVSPAVLNGETVAGDDIQLKTFWHAYQTAIEDLVVDGYASDQWWFDDGVSIATPNDSPSEFGGSSTIYHFEVAADIWLAVCDSALGPRRLPSGSSWPTDWSDYNDAAFSYGKMVVGDIIGPWLIQDLQLALSYLRFVDANDWDEDSDLPTPTINGYHEPSRTYRPMRFESNTSATDAYDDHDDRIGDIDHGSGAPTLPTDEVLNVTFRLVRDSFDTVEFRGNYNVTYQDFQFDYTFPTYLSHKTSFIAQTKEDGDFLDAGYNYFAWKNSGISEGDFAYIGTESSWNTNSTAKISEVWDWTWDRSGFPFGSDPSTKTGQIAFYNVVICVEFQWTNAGMA